MPIERRALRERERRGQRIAERVPRKAGEARGRAAIRPAVSAAASTRMRDAPRVQMSRASAVPAAGKIASPAGTTRTANGSIQPNVSASTRNAWPSQ